MMRLIVPFRYLIFSLICVVFLLGGLSKTSAASNPYPFKVSYKEKIEAANEFLKLNAEQFKIKFQQDFASWQFPSTNILDNLLGYKPNPSVQIRNIMRIQNEVIYDAIYSIDEKGRRFNPNWRAKNRQKFLVLFGCSFAFGQGVNDDQTISHNLNILQSQYEVYNYGISASAANVMLAKIESTSFKDEVPEKDGDFVYIHLEAHVDRASAHWPTIVWMKDTPYYENALEGLLRKGTLSSEFPIRTKVLLSLGPFLDWIGRSNTIFPPLLKSDYDYTCRLIVESQKKIFQQYPKSKFIVYAHPDYTMNSSLRSCLKDNNVAVFQGNIDVQNTHFKFDGHPNAEGNQRVAQDLVQQLKLK